LKSNGEIWRFAFRKYGGSGVNNSIRTAPPTQETSLLRTPVVPDRRQVCEDSSRIHSHSLFAQAHGRDGEADYPCHYGQKMSRAAGSTPARAAQGMATTFTAKSLIEGEPGISRPHN